MNRQRLDRTIERSQSSVEALGVEAEGAAVSVSVEVPARPAPSPDAPLPRTGWDAGTLTAIGLALVLLGALVVLLVRTRLERTHA